MNPNNYPILLLGAGFSLGAKDGDNRPLVLADKLTDELYKFVLMPKIGEIEDYDLDKDKVEDALKNKNLKLLCTQLRNFGLVKERDAYLTERMINCNYDDKVDFGALSTYPWPYIFTLNIDDLVENIFSKNGKDLDVWTETKDYYDENPNKTILIKLHGDVNYGGRYVFDNDEYNRFIAKNPRILSKFADEYVSRDLIVLGTQFQEDDLKIVLDKLLIDGCITTNHQYFFISPNPFNRGLRNLISANDNFHYLQMTNCEFLEQLRLLKIQEDGYINILTNNSFSDWSKEYDYARKSEKTFGLYYGEPPKAKDFFYKIDIPRRLLTRGGVKSCLVEDDLKKYIANYENVIVTIHGEAYVGKTCIAMRLLTICAERGYKSFYSNNADIRVIERLKEYLRVQTEGNFAFCLENAASCYYKLSEIFLEMKNINAIIILTSFETQHQTKKHNLNNFTNMWCDYYISEKINYIMANDIYKKLMEHNHLGKLQLNSMKSTDIKRNIRHCKTFINVLWYAHEGRDFLAYFNDWYNQHIEESQIEMFNLLTFYSSIGCLCFPISFLPQLANELQIEEFLYQDFVREFSDFIIVDNSCLKLRYVSLFEKVVIRKISKIDKIKYISTMMKILAGRTYERDNSQYNLMFETVAKVRMIKKHTDLDNNDIIKIFDQVEKQCCKLSYYWIQRCIIFSRCEMFEEASNAISNAENARKYKTYQIIHAEAKNDMARGIWYVKKGLVEGRSYFEQGKRKIYSLIENKRKYKNAFAFSMHTYVGMSLDYYRCVNEFPNQFEWLCLKDSMWTLVEQTVFIDSFIEDIVNRFVSYACDNGHEKDVVGMKKKLKYKSRRWSDIGDYDIDQMPND